MRVPVDYSRNCDKCGLPVEPANDAVALDIALGGGAWYVLARPRHLLPTDHCEGSPSRAQYLEGQPPDERPGYPLITEVIPVMREAYERMQANA